MKKQKSLFTTFSNQNILIPVLIKIIETNLKESNDPALIKTASMHLEFEVLHPFQDGNGRIGRMLITLFLWKEGILSQPHLYTSGFLEENKDLYIETMRQVSETGNWEEWIKLF